MLDRGGLSCILKPEEEGAGVAFWCGASRRCRCATSRVLETCGTAHHEEVARCTGYRGTAAKSPGILTVVGGGWAFRTWSPSEYLRRRSELAPFDGQITAQSAEPQDGKDVLTVSCKGRNCGLVPLHVNTKATASRYSLFRTKRRMVLLGHAWAIQVDASIAIRGSTSVPSTWSPARTATCRRTFSSNAGAHISSPAGLRR